MDDIQRWTAPIAEPTDSGGFVAYGDYLALRAERDALRADAKRYRYITARTIITDESTPGMMVVTMVEDAIDEPNRFLHEMIDAALDRIDKLGEQ